MIVLPGNCGMTIYISGPITGIENCEENFRRAENELREKGFNVINPVEAYKTMPKDYTYEDIMRRDITMLDGCDGIYMLEGWEKSCGCNREYGFAIGAKKFIIKT